MEFVETYHAGGRSIYLPEVDLQGRAHAERIVRTVGSSERPTLQALRLGDPLNDRDKQSNPNFYLEDWKNKNQNHPNGQRYTNNPALYPSIWQHFKPVESGLRTHTLISLSH